MENRRKLNRKQNTQNGKKIRRSTEYNILLYCANIRIFKSLRLHTAHSTRHTRALTYLNLYCIKRDFVFVRASIKIIKKKSQIKSV